MELFRTLGALIEPPRPELRRLADALGLGPLPDETDHTELFLLQLYPYASIYLGAEGLIGGEARDRVAGFWRALGQTAPGEPDHLTVMLALHAELCERQDGADPSRRQRLRRAQKAWLWEHLLSWLPVYLAKLDDVAPPFYQRWGALLLEALAEEAVRLGRQQMLPLHLRAAPGLPDPRDGDPEAFLDGLLAPARSGFVLARVDLARAVRELGLGLRMGQRKYALRALLSQDAPAILGWLAREAAAWAARHRARDDLLGPVAVHWAERAEATAALVDRLRNLTRSAHERSGLILQGPDSGVPRITSARRRAG